MKTEFYLARRYLLNRRHGSWGWLIGWLATGSVALGVAALIITLAVMTGFRDDIRAKILGIQPHVILTSFVSTMERPSGEALTAIEKTPGLKMWSPYISGQVLAGYRSQNSGALIKGIDPEKEPLMSGLKGKLLDGEWADLHKKNGKPGIILGQELARNIGIRKGDVIWIMPPNALNLGVMSIPQVHLFEVVGIVQSGLYDYDSSLAYVGLSSADQVFGLGGNVSGIGMWLDDVEKADEVAFDLQQRMEGLFWVRSWLSLNKNLFSALKLEKTVMFIILILVTVVASVMIISNLLLSISQKTKEIGILRAMGATEKTIERVFFYQGALMGGLGTLIGAALGILLSMILSKTQWIQLPADVYYIDRLPVKLVASDIVTVTAASFLIVIVATLIPARRAAKLDPLDAIRYG